MKMIYQLHAHFDTETGKFGQMQSKIDEMLQNDDSESDWKKPKDNFLVLKLKSKLFLHLTYFWTYNININSKYLIKI